MQILNLRHICIHNIYIIHVIINVLQGCRSLILYGMYFSITGSFSQISDQPNDIDESHKGAAFAASNSPTNTCNIREKSSQASSQSNDVDTSHKEAIISDDGVEVVDTSPQNIEHEDINPHNLIVGSVIEYDEPVQHACGEIRWIGKLPSETQTYAGVEMVKPGCYL